MELNKEKKDANVTQFWPHVFVMLATANYWVPHASLIPRFRDELLLRTQASLAFCFLLKKQFSMKPRQRVLQHFSNYYEKRTILLMHADVHWISSCSQSIASERYAFVAVKHPITIWFRHTKVEQIQPKRVPKSYEILYALVHVFQFKVSSRRECPVSCYLVTVRSKFKQWWHMIYVDQQWNRGKSEINKG